MPLSRTANTAAVVSGVVALLMAAASLAGLVADVYPTEELRLAFVPNDVANLLIGLPILLGALWMARRGQLVGLLLWPGALFFVVYTYLVYLVALPVSLLYLAYLALVTLSLYAMAALLASLDAGAVQQRLGGVVPERLAAAVLTGLGGLVLLHTVGVVVDAASSQAALPITERALLAADLLTAPAWIIGGLLLWRREGFGYVVGPGLLFQSSMLFVGLIVVLVLQPVLTDAAFLVTDVIVVALMGLVSFVPFGLFVRRLMTQDAAPAMGD